LVILDGVAELLQTGDAANLLIRKHGDDAGLETCAPD
jgi:hypothetical protein